MTHSTILFAVSVIAAAFLAPAAGSQTPAMAMPSVPHTEWAKFGEPGNRAEGNRLIRITATDQRFIPASITVPKGQIVTFEVKNVSTLKHEFAIGDAAFHIQHEKEMAAMPDMEMKEVNAVAIPPGKTRTLTWHFTRRGDFIYACDMPDHDEAGMKGTVHVR